MGPNIFWSHISKLFLGFWENNFLYLLLFSKLNNFHTVATQNFLMIQFITNFMFTGKTLSVIKLDWFIDGSTQLKKIKSYSPLKERKVFLYWSENIFWKRKGREKFECELRKDLISIVFSKDNSGKFSPFVVVINDDNHLLPFWMSSQARLTTP